MALEVDILTIDSEDGRVEATVTVTETGSETTDFTLEVVDQSSNTRGGAVVADTSGTVFGGSRGTQKSYDVSFVPRSSSGTLEATVTEDQDTFDPGAPARDTATATFEIDGDGSGPGGGGGGGTEPPAGTAEIEVLDVETLATTVEATVRVFSSSDLGRTDYTGNVSLSVDGEPFGTQISGTVGSGAGADRKTIEFSPPTTGGSGLLTAALNNGSQVQQTVALPTGDPGGGTGPGNGSGGGGQPEEPAGSLRITSAEFVNDAGGVSLRLSGSNTDSADILITLTSDVDGQLVQDKQGATIQLSQITPFVGLPTNDMSNGVHQITVRVALYDDSTGATGDSDEKVVGEVQVGSGVDPDPAPCDELIAKYGDLMYEFGTPGEELASGAAREASNQLDQRDYDITAVNGLAQAIDGDCVVPQYPCSVIQSDYPELIEQYATGGTLSADDLGDANIDYAQGNLSQEELDVLTAAFEYECDVSQGGGGAGSDAASLGLLAAAGVGLAYALSQSG
jgi:hypothetical protein